MEHRNLLENILFDLLKDPQSPLNNYCDYQIQHICRQIGVEDFGDLKDYTFYKQFANQFLNYLDQVNETQSIIQSALQSHTLQNNIIDDHQNQFKQINQHQIITQNQNFIPPKTINNQIHIIDDDILEISNPILNLEVNHIKTNPLPNFNTQIHTQHQQQQLINQQLQNNNQKSKINKPEPLLKIDSKPSPQFQTNTKKNISSSDFKKKANNLIRNIEQKEAQFNKLQLNTSSSEERQNIRLDIIKKKESKTTQNSKNNDSCCLEISDFKHSEDQSISKDSNLKKSNFARNLTKQNNKLTKERSISKKKQSKEKIVQKKKNKSITCEKKEKETKEKVKIQKKDLNQTQSSIKEKKSDKTEKNHIQRIEKDKSQQISEKKLKELKQKELGKVIKEKEVIEINQSTRQLQLPQQDKEIIGITQSMKQLQLIQKEKENKQIDKEIKEFQDKIKRMEEFEKEQILFKQNQEIKEKEKKKQLELLEQQRKQKEQQEKLLKEQEQAKILKLQQEQKKAQREAELTLGQLKDRDDAETNKFQSNEQQLGTDIIQNIELWDMVSKFLCTNDQQEITQKKQVQNGGYVSNNEKSRKKKEKEQTKHDKTQCNYCTIGETKSIIEISDGIRMCSYCLLEGLNPLQKILYKACFVEHRCSGKEGGKTSQQFSIDQNLNCNLEIRCIAVNKNNIYDFTFPMHCSISVNGLVIKEFKPLQDKSSLKKRKDQSLIITYKELLKYNSSSSYSSKKMVFQCVEHSTDNGFRKDQIGTIYCFGLFQVQSLTVNQAVERYRELDLNSKINVEQCKSEIKIEKYKVSLICQFSSDYMFIPAKGQYCQHKQCFCLQNYLEIMSKAEHRKWSCPICKKLCFNLVIDKYQKFVIDRVKQLEIAVEQIILDQDGLLDKEDEINKILQDSSIKSYSDIIIRNYTNIQKIERQEDEEDEKIPQICVSNKKDFILIDD